MKNRSQIDGLRPVPNPTMREQVIAGVLAYIKVPLVFYPLAMACNYLFEGTSGFISLVIGTIIVFAVCCIGLAVIFTLPHCFTVRLHGKVQYWQFRGMYIGGAAMAVLGLLSLIDVIFLKMTLADILGFFLLPVTHIEWGLPGGAVSLCLIIGGGVLLLGTAVSHGSRCRNCRGYDYEENTDIKGTYHSEQIGTTVTKTTERKEGAYHRLNEYYYVQDPDDVTETTDTTKTFATVVKRRKTCRYCGMDYGVHDHHGTYTETETKKDYYRIRH